MSVSQTIPVPQPADPRRVVLRYTFAERVNHWMSALTYIYCLWTGLAFWSPYLFWMATVVGGGPSARFWHPWFGLIFAISIVIMHQAWRNDMRITSIDLAWKEKIGHYIRNEDEQLPPVGRFNYGQKFYFWLMFYGTIVLVISGFGLWFVESIPWNWHWLRYLAVFLHVSSAMATIGAFIIHVYMGTAMVRGGFTSIVRGQVSAAWVRAHHRLWYDQITGQKPPRN